MYCPGIDNADLCACGDGKYRCIGSDRCVDSNKFCNGGNECPNGDDEKNCGKLHFRLYGTFCFKEPAYNGLPLFRDFRI